MDMINKETMRQAALEGTLALIRRNAMIIVAYPKGDREHLFRIVQKGLEEASELFEAPPLECKRWVAIVMQALRALIAEIDAGGGSAGGRA